VEGLAQVPTPGFGIELRPEGVDGVLAVESVSGREREELDQVGASSMPPPIRRDRAAVDLCSEAAEE
jgi:hypothetical protein